MSMNILLREPAKRLSPTSAALKLAMFEVDTRVDDIDVDSLARRVVIDVRIVDRSVVPELERGDLRDEDETMYPPGRVSP